MGASFEPLIGFTQDASPAWGTSDIEVGVRSPHSFPMGSRREQARLSRWEKEHCNEIRPEGLGFNLLKGDLKPITVLILHLAFFFFIWHIFKIQP